MKTPLYDEIVLAKRNMSKEIKLFFSLKSIVNENLFILEQAFFSGSIPDGPMAKNISEFMDELIDYAQSIKNHIKEV